jgi:CBS domain containing-hemolysin-like protein
MPLTMLVTLLLPSPARASFLPEAAMETAANVLAWVVLIIAPTVGIAVFWMLHILPEKIAEKRHHPQAKAIQCLCLLSLVFGGLLWPIAWLWAYSKPVLYKLAYGTDTVKHEPHEEQRTTPEDETIRLRERIAELESSLIKNGGRV